MTDNERGLAGTARSVFIAITILRALLQHAVYACRVQDANRLLRSDDRLKVCRERCLVSDDCIMLINLLTVPSVEQCTTRADDGARVVPTGRRAQSGTKFSLRPGQPSMRRDTEPATRRERERGEASVRRV